MGKHVGLTEAEIARVIRAAKKEGCGSVEIVKGRSRAVVRFGATQDFDEPQVTGASAWDAAIVRASN